MAGAFTRLKKYSRPTQMMPATKCNQRSTICSGSPPPTGNCTLSFQRTSQTAKAPAVIIVPPNRIQSGAVIGRHCKRSEEHTSELQSRPHLVCRLLLEKKNEPVEGEPAGIPHATPH